MVFICEIIVFAIRNVQMAAFIWTRNSFLASFQTLDFNLLIVSQIVNINSLFLQTKEKRKMIKLFLAERCWCQPNNEFHIFVLCVSSLLVCVCINRCNGNTNDFTLILISVQWLGRISLFMLNIFMFDHFHSTIGAALTYCAFRLSVNWRNSKITDSFSFRLTISLKGCRRNKRKRRFKL